jgi:hypothetical protein
MSTGAKVLLGLLIGFFVLLILGVGGCVACSALLGGGADEEDAGRDFGTVDVGEPIKVSDAEYTVTDVRTADRVSDEEAEEGTFVLVDVRFRYLGNEPDETVDTYDLQLRTRSGERFDVDEAALPKVDDPLLEETWDDDWPETKAVVQPRQTLEGTLIYDIPDSDVARSQLLVHALQYGNGRGYINLGL